MDFWFAKWNDVAAYVDTTFRHRNRHKCRHNLNMVQPIYFGPILTQYNFSQFWYKEKVISNNSRNMRQSICIYFSQKNPVYIYNIAVYKSFHVIIIYNTKYHTTRLRSSTIQFTSTKHINFWSCCWGSSSTLLMATIMSWRGLWWVALCRPLPNHT